MMTDIIERTLASVPNLLSSSSKKDGGASKAFQNFIQLVGNCKTKREESIVVQKEITLQKQKLSQPSVTPAQKRESLVRLAHCHMLGHDISFAYIHAVKLAQQGSLLEKRVGYLTCSLFLDDSHELVMLLINTIQKDLRSTNLLEVCFALSAASSLVSAEMMPALIPSVEDKLTHSREVVRKKAVICLHQFWRKAPELTEHLLGHLPRVLSDRDPSVVWASLHLYHDLIKIKPEPYRKLVMAFVGILEQIIARKLPKDYEYHSVPAPWMVILLLKMLANLGAGDKVCSEQMYVIIKEVMQRTEPSQKMGLAVIYECLETIASIYPHPGLIQHATQCTGRFLSASNINLKYLGLKALGSLVLVSPQCAVEHQDVVMDCLSHTDDMIRRKTLELLYRMANPVNVKIICGKLLENLKSTTDQYRRLDLLNKITDLIERFAENLEWYVNTTNYVLMMSSDFGPQDATDKVVDQLKKIMDSQTDKKKENSTFLTTTYMNLLQKDKVPEVVIRISVYVIGEYCPHCDGIDVVDASRLMLKWFNKSKQKLTKLWITHALRKVCVSTYDKEKLSLIIELMPSEKPKDEDIDNYEHIARIRNLCQRTVDSDDDFKLWKVLGSSPEEYDLTLSFLDEFVSKALENGAMPFLPYSIKFAPAKPKTNSFFQSLGLDTYERKASSSLASASTISAEKPASIEHNYSGSAISSRSQDFEEYSTGLKPAKKVWSLTGYIKPEERSNEPVKLDDNEEENNSTSMHESSADPRLVDEEDVEKEKRKLLASAIFGGLPSSETSISPGSTTLSGAIGGDSEYQSDFPSSTRSLQAATSADSEPVNSSSRDFTLPFDEPNSYAASRMGLLQAGDFQSPSDGPSMYSSFKMDDLRDPGFVSVDHYYSFPGANSAHSVNSYWNFGSPKSDNYGSQSSDSPSKRTSDSLMSTSDSMMKWQAPHRLYEEDACTTETVTEPSDSLENVSAACGSDTDDAPPLEFHNEADVASSKSLGLTLQRTLSIQSQDKLVVHECDTLHVEVVKRPLPQNLELVLWLSFLDVDNIENSVLNGIKLNVKSTSAFLLEVPDSESHAPNEFLLSGLHCEVSSCAPISLLLNFKDTYSMFQETLNLELHFPLTPSKTVDVQVPITPLDFIRPTEKTITDFSQLWPTLSSDCKVNVSNNGNQEVETWTLLLSEFTHLHVIQIQDEESLLCGEWLGKDDQILLHCRVRQDMVHLWVKSDSDSLLQMISSCLSSLG